MTSTLALPVVASKDGFAAYNVSIRAYPVLSAEEEYELASRFRRDNDLEAARQLVLSHLRLVTSIARSYIGYGLSQADLVQEGNIGLMKAVKRFDPDRGVRLVSFAIHWIKAEIHEYIVRNWRLVKIATTKAQRKLFFNLRSIRKGVGSLRTDEINAIARELNVNPEDVLEMEARFYGQEMSLDGDQDDDEDHFSPIAYLPDNTMTPLEYLDQIETEQRTNTGLAHALQSLDARSRRIIEARWLQEKEGKTLHDLASEFGVSAERIRQIEQSAIKKIRKLMTEAVV